MKSERREPLTPGWARGLASLQHDLVRIDSSSRLVVSVRVGNLEKRVTSSMRQIVDAFWLHEICLPVGTWRYPAKSLNVCVHLLLDPPHMNTCSMYYTYNSNRLVIGLDDACQNFRHFVLNFSRDQAPNEDHRPCDA